MNEQIDTQTSCFVAIDFETLYPQHESACAVGMVKYKGGVVLGQFYSLIRPPEMTWNGRCNSDIHGIQPTMLESAPSFEDLFPLITVFVGDAIPVAHNASVERCCFEKCCRFYQLQKPVWVDYFEDTFKMTGLKLVDACKDVGIDTDRHHDPLQDAMMCALLHMSLIGTKPAVPVPTERKRKRSSYPKIKQEDRNPIPDDEVKCKDTPFFHSAVVYTGEFLFYPDRRELGSLLRSLGAKVETNITKKTKYLICGANPGPKKVEIARERSIVMIEEQDFYLFIGKLKFEP